MYVTKASGKRERFDRGKIIRTCLRSGASKSLAEDIAMEIEDKVREGVSTKSILSMVMEALEEKIPQAATRYDLKGAIMRLGPSGFPFEIFAGEVLMEYGYRIEWRKNIRGLCINHEVDIIATSRSGKRHLIECKYHNYAGLYTGIKDVLYVYARFLDIMEAAQKGEGENFDSPWIICNTRYSEDAIKFGDCRGITTLGWGHPKNEGLEKLVEKRKLYPITMLSTIRRTSMEKLAEQNLMLVKDILKRTPLELSKLLDMKKGRAKEIAKEAESLLDGN